MIVPTAYVSNGLLDAYDLLKDSKLLEMAISATDFIAKDLNKIEQDDLFAFSYSPLDKTVVFNASLMASQVLARVQSYTGDQKYMEEASKSVQSCIAVTRIWALLLVFMGHFLRLLDVYEASTPLLPYQSMVVYATHHA